MIIEWLKSLQVLDVQAISVSKAVIALLPTANWLFYKKKCNHFFVIFLIVFVII